MKFSGRRQLSEDERTEQLREAVTRAVFSMHELLGTMAFTAKRVAEATESIRQCGDVMDQLVARSVAELTPDERDHYNDLILIDEPELDAIVTAKRRVRKLRRASQRMWARPSSTTSSVPSAPPTA